MIRKFVVPLIVLLAGTLLSYLAYDHFYELDMTRGSDEFVRRSENVASILTEGVQGYSGAVDSLKNLTSLSTGDKTDNPMTNIGDTENARREWRNIKAIVSRWADDTIASFPGYRGLGWAVYSPNEDLPALEAAGKVLIAPDFEIKQVLEGDALGEVPVRDSHFPVFYMEPLDLNRGGLGLDMAGAVETREAIVEARDTGNIISTAPVEWLNRQLGQPGFFVYRSVYFNEESIETIEDRVENLYAVAFGVIMIEDMLNYAIRGLDEEGVDFFVFPHHNDEAIFSGNEEPVFAWNDNDDSFMERKAISEKYGAEHKAVFGVVGRNWSVYCFPSDDFFPGFLSTNARNAAIVGMLLTFLLASYLYQSANRTHQIQALVHKRTEELSKTNDDLEQEMVSRIKADEHRQELESQLLQSQKMESIGQLAGGIAHDFNNLLVAILGYSELTLSNLDKDSINYENVEQIMGAGERAKVLVRQLLAFSRQQVLELTDLNVNTVLADLGLMIERVIGEHITLRVIENAELQTIRADRGQLEQIILNLCVNSRDAMGDGGTLTIEMENQEIDAEFCETYTWASPGSFVKLSVTDNGCGMDSETQDRIFDPFFTTKKMGEGTGLGLSTVFGLVSQHNGLINVYSEVNIGTTFKIYFPAVSVEESREQRTPIDFLHAGAGTVLFADDDELVRGVTDRILSNSGYTVIMARDGVEAIELFEQYKSEIDFVLLDVVMPKLGGRAVAEHIDKEHPELPILFCSGYSSDAIHTNFVLEKGMQLIQKPYHREDLLTKIRELMKKRTS